MLRLPKPTAPSTTGLQRPQGTALQDTGRKDLASVLSVRERQNRVHFAVHGPGDPTKMLPVVRTSGMIGILDRSPE